MKVGKTTPKSPTIGRVFPTLRTKTRGVLEGFFSNKCAPLWPVALWVPHVLLGPISLGIFVWSSFLGHDTGFCRNPFAKTPLLLVPDSSLSLSLSLFPDFPPVLEKHAQTNAKSLRGGSWNSPHGTLETAKNCKKGGKLHQSVTNCGPQTQEIPCNKLSGSHYPWAPRLHL